MANLDFYISIIPASISCGVKVIFRQNFIFFYII